MRIYPAAVVLLFTACAHQTSPPPTAVPPAKPPVGALTPWKEAVADTSVIEGLLRLRQRKDGALLVELAPDQLGKDFALSLHIRSGTGDFYMLDGMTLMDPMLVQFTRAGSRVLLRARNSFTGEVASVLAALKIESAEEKTGALLVDLTPFLVSDQADLTGILTNFFKPDKPPAFDAERSVVQSALGFPKNDEIDVLLTYGATAPALPGAGGEGVSDYRSIPVVVRYSLFALPETPMRPRIEDDRVGYFATYQYDFTQPDDRSGLVSLLVRRRLEKRDPEAALSEPVEPIVYYIDHNVPAKWRPAVRAGVLAWNEAFATAGIKDALVVRDAPDDPAWDPDDIRATTISWLETHAAPFGAVGPSSIDPRTGEILSSHILIWSEIVRAAFAPAAQYWDVGGAGGRAGCAAGLNLAHELAFGAFFAGTASEGSLLVPDEFLADAIRSLTMHEVGHTLGLRHNFRASGSVPFDKQHDKDWTRKNGISGSVMDYAPVNLAIDPDHQGYYWDPALGEYDRWAVRYGYSSFSPEDEAQGLAAIAQQSNQPGHEYGTDEDAYLGGETLDPLTGVSDMTDDPIRWGTERLVLVDQAIARLPQLLRDDESWDRVRRLFAILTLRRTEVVLNTVRFVGGVAVNRDHKGQQGARPAYQPLPAARQRQALARVIAATFVDGALAIDPDLASKLLPRHDLLGPYVDTPTVAIDFPLHRVLLVVQSTVLDSLLDPARLGRIIDNSELTRDKDRFALSELFRALSDAIWPEVLTGKPREISSFRRNLQRAYLDRLVRLAIPGQQPPAQAIDSSLFFWRRKPPVTLVPEDARSLARWELTRLDRALAGAIKASGKLSVETQAHLAETKTRVERALAAEVQTTP